MGKKARPKSSKLNNTRMKAYVSEDNQGHGKFRPPPHEAGKGPSKQEKLIAKNANRAKKKSARQEAKQQIRKALNK